MNAFQTLVGGDPLGDLAYPLLVAEGVGPSAVAVAAVAFAE